MSGVDYGSPSVTDCACCWEDLDESNYVAYSINEDGGPWLSSTICAACAERLRTTQFGDFVKALGEVDCLASFRRLMEQLETHAGPPMYVSNKDFLPVPEGTLVKRLYYGTDKKERSAMLEGCLVGEERTAFWEEKKQFWVDEESEEDDDMEDAEPGERGDD